MRVERQGALAIAALVVSALFFGAALLLLGGTPKSARVDTVGAEDSVAVSAAFAALMLVFASTGTLIVVRRRGNTIGWLLVAVGVTTGFNEFVSWYAQYGFAHPDAPPGATTAAWITQAIDWLAASLLVLLFLLFPTGRPPSRGWRRLVWIWAGWLALTIGLGAVTPGPLWYAPGVENPHALEGVPLLSRGHVEDAASLLWAALVVAAAIALGIRFRRARGIERQQLKWFLLSAALLALALAVVIVFVFVSRDENTAAAGGTVAIFIGMSALAASTGIAILRYRLYDIDLVINRTLVYGSLTALLAGTYLGLVLLLQLLLNPLTSDNALAVAGSTLAVAALFRPARSRIQAIVDRRFYRRRYDAARTLEAFSARLRDEIDLDALAAELRATIRDTMQPAHVSLWLREARR